METTVIIKGLYRGYIGGPGLLRLVELVSCGCKKTVDGVGLQLGSTGFTLTQQIPASASRVLLLSARRPSRVSSKVRLGLVRLTLHTRLSSQGRSVMSKANWMYGGLVSRLITDNLGYSMAYIYIEGILT